VDELLALLNWLRQRAEQDPELRRLLRAAADALHALAREGAPPPAESPAAPLPPSVPREPVISAEAAAAKLTAEWLGPVPAAAPRPAVAEVPRLWHGGLEWLPARARLKAEATRWLLERDRLMQQGAFDTDVQPRDRDLIARAKLLPNCYLWMSSHGGLSVGEPARLMDLAGAFEAMAAAAELLRQLVPQAEEQREAFEQALDLAAEAQSMVRVAVERVASRPDQDQDGLFRWLRSAANEFQILIRRHMRLDDPADPADSAGLFERIAWAEHELQAARQRQTQFRQRMNRLQYHLKRVSSEDEEEARQNWLRVVEIVDGEVLNGTPPSNIEIRDLLLPFVEQMPDLGEPPPGFARVLRELERYLVSRAPEPDPRAAPEDTPEIRTAAELLRGRDVVLIGGVARPHAREKLERAFELRRLEWITTREHQSIAEFEAPVAREETALVLLAIRWSSHSFNDVKQFCDKYGKPLVRLPAGYGPNQVAVQILQQRGVQLRAQLR
jgi:hypothetical protein